jgi:hypothetical protein
VRFNLHGDYPLPSQLYRRQTATTTTTTTAAAAKR